MGKKNKRKAVDDTLVAEHSEDHVSVEDVSAMETQTGTEKPSKKHKKHKKSKEATRDIISEAAEESGFVAEQARDKKKKKKRKSEDELEEDKDSKHSKAKRKKLNEHQDENKSEKAVEMLACCETEILPSSKDAKKAKKQRKRLRDEADDSMVSSSKDITEVAEISEKKIKKHKKNKRKLCEESPVVNDMNDLAEGNSISISNGELKQGKQKKHKKSKTDKVTEVNRTEIENSAHMSSNSSTEVVPQTKEKGKKKKKQKSEDKKNQEEDLPDDMKDTKEKVQHRKKAKNKERVEERDSHEENGLNDIEETAEKEKQKKKSKKKQKKEEDCLEVHGSEGTIDPVQKVKEKKKIKKKEKVKQIEETKKQIEKNDNDSDNDSSKAKHKAKQETVTRNKENDKLDECKDCVETNSSVEVHLKYKKSDNDTNRSVVNGAEEPQTNQSQAVNLGQWSTNMFKSDERQNKFIRLLGGFKNADKLSSNSGTPGQKKGLFGSLQLKQDSSSGGQSALTYQRAEQMNRRLESDYERALSFSAKGQRGVGLGFTPDPAEGKKFHIDINRIASKKFD